MPNLKSKLQTLREKSDERKSTVKENLDRLYSREITNKIFPDDSQTRQQRGMHEFVAGEYINTAFGDIFIGKAQYEKDYLHGSVPILSIQQTSDDWLSRWGKFIKPKIFDYKKTIFVDTETTGLAGAGGTLAFLVGIGYFYRNEFRVEQFFVDSHSREEGMLDLISDFVKPFDTVVTFNGKTFDIPLLETRYLLKRKQSPFAEMDHLDLLHPSRQLWNLTLKNCKLQTIERTVIGFHRVDDLPGDEVPSAYFKYIRFGNPDPLYLVFKHNADDIVSLAALTFLLWQQTKGDSGAIDSLVAFSKGKIYSRMGDIGSAIKSMRIAIKNESSVHRRLTVKSHLSMLLKSQGDWGEAKIIWEEMSGDEYPFYLLPYIELAKYYEHRGKDLSQAKQIVIAALEKIPQRRTQDIDDLQYRLSRLKRKMEKLNE